jgi:hypothetical protein
LRDVQIALPAPPVPAAAPGIPKDEQGPPPGGLLVRRGFYGTSHPSRTPAAITATGQRRRAPQTQPEASAAAVGVAALWRMRESLSGGNLAARLDANMGGLLRLRRGAVNVISHFDWQIWDENETRTLVPHGSSIRVSSCTRSAEQRSGRGRSSVLRRNRKVSTLREHSMLRSGLNQP